MSDERDDTKIRTVAEVEAELNAIRDCAGDPEQAHGREDDLWLGVLRAIAAGEAEDPVAMARLAATSDDIKFSRWYA